MKMLRIALLSPILMLVVFASCSSNPEDIRLADLQEPCDHIEALEVCADAIYDIALNATFKGQSFEDLSESDQERLDALLVKVMKIIRSGKKHLDARNDDYYYHQSWTSAYRICPSFESLEAKIKKLASQDQGAFYFIQNYIDELRESMNRFDIGGL